MLTSSSWSNISCKHKPFCFRASTNLSVLGHLVHYLDDSYFPNINLKIKWILFLNYETIHSHYIDNILRLDLISSRIFFLIVLWFCKNSPIFLH